MLNESVGLQLMFFQMFQSERETTILCPYCHEDVLEQELMLVVLTVPMVVRHS
jgi:hypothetical protein